VQLADTIRKSPALLLAWLAMPLPCLAGEPSDPTIVVTARRIDEHAQEVPLNVAVIPAGDITTGGVEGLQTLAARVPGLSFESLWGGANAFPTLRGQSQPSIAGDAVGMFVDGVYQANRDVLDVEPLDLERIEVVRGPQSALFGHSSFAGLIHYVPAAPTEQTFFSASADIATDNLYGLKAVVSGPIDAAFKARIAASWRQSDGTWENSAQPGQHLGNMRRLALAAMLATRNDAGPLSLRLSARFGESHLNQPPFYSLDYRHYNCGGRDPASGVWSYFCGAAPISSRFSLSPNLPDSHSRSGQVALHLSLELDGIELRSDSSFYGASAQIYRDFDGSAEGDLYGVCQVGLNCSGPATQTIPVIRLQRVNIVQHHPAYGREIAQEFRVQSTGEHRFTWMFGTTAFWTRQDQRTNFAYGAESGALAASERLTSLVLANPLQVGPLATVNFALVDDPGAQQIVQNDAIEYRSTLAVFSAAEYRLAADMRLRGELRASWERLSVDSRTANFAPSFGKTLGARTFFDLTPRFSIDYRPASDWLVYASYARGSRSGGINTIPNLLPQEQTFEPETNWTAEAGLKYAGQGLLRSAELTVYDIDWHNTQIAGFATTPGVPVLITRNTVGLHTQGVELAIDLVPAPWLAFDFAYSYTHPRFKNGSEDPGSNAYCGLAPGVTSSSFCVIRPSLINPGQLVPDISGNIPARVAETSWAASASLAPSWRALRGIRLRLDLSHQGNVFDRQIDGLYYGERTLLNARLSIPVGSCSLELWGTNLGDDRYVRFAVGRQPAFYLGIPRPTDLILGDGRRIGVTLRYPN
jgi:iron complex outermembrane receptor protein